MWSRDSFKQGETEYNGSKSLQTLQIIITYFGHFIPEFDRDTIPLIHKAQMLTTWLPKQDQQFQLQLTSQHR